MGQIFIFNRISKSFFVSQSMKKNAEAYQVWTLKIISNVECYSFKYVLIYFFNSFFALSYFEIACTNRYMIMNVVDCEINSLVIDMFRNFLRLFPSRYMIGPHKNHEKVILTFVVNALTQMDHNGTVWILWFSFQTVVHIQLRRPRHVIRLSHVGTIPEGSLGIKYSIGRSKWLNRVPTT